MCVVCVAWLYVCVCVCVLRGCKYVCVLCAVCVAAYGMCVCVCCVVCVCAVFVLCLWCACAVCVCVCVCACACVLDLLGELRRHGVDIHLIQTQFEVIRAIMSENSPHALHEDTVMSTSCFGWWAAPAPGLPDPPGTSSGKLNSTRLKWLPFSAACAGRDCRSAAPPSPFSRRFNRDEEGVAVEWHSRRTANARQTPREIVGHRQRAVLAQPMLGGERPAAPTPC